MSSTKKRNLNRLSDHLIKLGLSLLVVGVSIFILTFFPVIKEEVKYQLLTKKDQDGQAKTKIKPLDEDFGILIPKIGANARVIANVDPFVPNQYQRQLTKGVAHAAGSALPGQIGNTFIFAHSSVDWYTANRFNSVFYLLYKLETGDEIDLYYQKHLFRYRLIDKKIVDASQINYLTEKTTNKILTLMTCWPPGTTLKRLIVRGELVPVSL